MFFYPSVVTLFNIIIVVVVEWKFAYFYEFFKIQSDMVFLHFKSKYHIYVFEGWVKYPHQCRKPILRHFAYEALQLRIIKILDKIIIIEKFLFQVVWVKKFSFFIVTGEVVFLILGREKLWAVWEGTSGSDISLLCHSWWWRNGEKILL